jgi:Zn-dependent protease
MTAAAEDLPAESHGISLFRIAGIQVRLDYSWFLIFLLVLASLSLGYLPRAHPEQPAVRYWLAGAAATLLFFLSIVIHELAHALVALRAGIRVPSITLFLFGGASQLADEPSQPGIELRVAAVGPLTSFLLAAVFWLAGRALPPATPALFAAVVDYLAWINVALGVFNLLPGFPLDGGRVLRALVWRRTGSLRRATRVAADAGKGLAIGIMLLGGLQIFSGALVGGLWLVFIGMFLRTMAEAGYQNLVLLQSLEDVAAGDVAIREPLSVEPQLTVQELVDDFILPHGYRGFPVVERGSVQGLIALEDLRDLPSERWRTTRVKERMRPLEPALRVSPDAPLADALRQLAQAPTGRLLVMRGDELVGMLTKSGLARFVEIRHLLDDRT